MSHVFPKAWPQAAESMPQAVSSPGSPPKSQSVPWKCQDTATTSAPSIPTKPPKLPIKVFTSPVRRATPLLFHLAAHGASLCATRRVRRPSASKRGAGLPLSAAPWCATRRVRWPSASPPGSPRRLAVRDQAWAEVFCESTRQPTAPCCARPGVGGGPLRVHQAAAPAYLTP